MMGVEKIKRLYIYFHISLPIVKNTNHDDPVSETTAAETAY